MVAGELVVRDGSIIAFLLQRNVALKSHLFAHFGSFKFQLIDFCFSATCNSLLMHLVACICCRYSLD